MIKENKYPDSEMLSAMMDSLSIFLPPEVLCRLDTSKVILDLPGRCGVTGKLSIDMSSISIKSSSTMYCINKMRKRNMFKINNE